MSDGPESLEPTRSVPVVRVSEEGTTTTIDRAATEEPLAEVAQAGQSPGTVLGKHQDAYVVQADAGGPAGRRGGAGQVQRHHHAATGQLAETSCGHAVTPPVGLGVNKKVTGRT